MYHGFYCVPENFSFSQFMHCLLFQEIEEDDERALEMFMNRDGKTGRTLADIIQEKITEKHTELQTQFSDAGSKFCLCLFSNSRKHFDYLFLFL